MGQKPEERSGNVGRGLGFAPWPVHTPPSGSSRRRGSFLDALRVVLVLLACGSLRAQVVATEKPGEPASHAERARAAALGDTEPIRLGDSAVELVGPWRFQTGDNPAWARPEFDDSGWRLMDMNNGPAGADPALGSNDGLPGWTARGYPGYNGYAWYRLRMRVDGAHRSLALKMPDNADDAYQVFVNGTMIGELGKFTAHGVTAYAYIPQSFRLPKSVRNGPAVVAIRMWMDSATPFSSPDAGGMHGPPVLGYASSIASEVRLDFDQTAHALGSGFLEALILFMALLMAAALFWLDSDEKAYFWLALVCAVTLLGNSITLTASLIKPVGQTIGEVLHDIVATPFRIGLWVLFWAYWFRLRRMRALHLAVWSLVVLLALGTAMTHPPLYGDTIPVEAARAIMPLLLAAKLGLGALLIAVAYRGFQRQKAEGGLAAAAVVLAFTANFQSELRLIHVAMRTSILGFSISLGQISTILSLLIITVMLLRRFVHSQRQQEQWRLEIEQARHVQQVLIPDRLPEIAGLVVQSEYRPHREVGGDFFQVLPREIAGEPLVVVGDVTGKGLQAGMLVALIVGAIRTAAQQSSEPARILSAINDQLCEREHASATCMILRVAEDGTVDLAHAGHLPPYLNGTEMQIEGALPLGMICGIDFPTVCFRLQPGDRLTLMSDGIAEAQDAHGKLFGFDRVNALLQRGASPAEVANVAQKFGQADDILVVQVQWLGMPVADRIREAQLATT